jgi:hypothetical protein
LGRVAFLLVYSLLFHAQGERDTPSPSAATAAPQPAPGVDVAAALRPPYATPAAKTDAFAAALAALTDARVTGACHRAALSRACADVASEWLKSGEAAVGLQWSLCAAFLRDFPRADDDEADGPAGLHSAARPRGSRTQAGAPRLRHGF